MMPEGKAHDIDRLLECADLLALLYQGTKPPHCYVNVRSQAKRTPYFDVVFRAVRFDRDFFAVGVSLVRSMILLFLIT
jgi:hypothetical protein